MIQQHSTTTTTTIIFTSGADPPLSSTPPSVDYTPPWGKFWTLDMELPTPRNPPYHVRIQHFVELWHERYRIIRQTFRMRFHRKRIKSRKIEISKIPCWAPCSPSTVNSKSKYRLTFFWLLDDTPTRNRDMKDTESWDQDTSPGPASSVQDTSL